MTQTPFIQKWTQKTTPDRIRQLLTNYNGEDLVFIPHNTKQKFKITGKYPLEYTEIDIHIDGFNYTLSPGFIFKCEKLEITFDNKEQEIE